MVITTGSFESLCSTPKRFDKSLGSAEACFTGGGVYEVWFLVTVVLSRKHCHIRCVLR